MDENYWQQRWGGISKSHKEAGAVPALSKVLANEKGKDFVLSLKDGEAKICMTILDRVSCDLHLLLSPPHAVRQGIMERNLQRAEKQTFFVTLRRLAERNGGLPDRLMITDIEILDEVHAFGGFGVVRGGTYRRERVAVKTAKVPSPKDLGKIRKVNINGIFVPIRRTVSTIPFQRFYREVVLWSTLSHPNILKLVGVHEDTDKRQFSTVSEWIGGGNIMEFIQGYRANRLELVHDISVAAIFIR